MKRNLILFLIIFLFCSATVYSQGLRYLSSQEFPRYDAILKAQGYPKLKTIFAVYDDSFSPPRAGLKCLDPRGHRYEVYITGDKIVNVKKIPGRERW
jgi:hypothetical protein